MAGEHTFPSYYGTVQAAWLSGKTAVGLVLETLARITLNR